MSDHTLTPKEQYEARKAARKAATVSRRESGHYIDDKDEVMMDLIDRFATAFERIADAMEARK